VSRAAQRAQAAGPERFRAPVRSTRPPVWKSLLAALLLMLVIIGLPVLLLATVGLPPIPTELGMDTLTQAISVDALLGVLIWVIWLAWMQFTFCTLVETVSAIRGRSVPGHVPFSGGVQAVALALGAGLKDMTAGYRAFRRQVLETVDLDELSNAGYIFQVDMAWRVVQEGFDVREVPITFTERAIGESKLDGSFVKDSLLEVTKWGIRHRKQQVTGLAREMRRLGAKGIQNWRKKHMI